MSSFVEKLLQNELPGNSPCCLKVSNDIVDGFKPYVTRRELLRDEKDKITAPNFLRPTMRGFFSQNWKHGNNLTQGDRGFSLELSDRIKIGKCYLRRKLNIMAIINNCSPIYSSEWNYSLVQSLFRSQSCRKIYFNIS
jgi:hypothetical protein